MADLSDETDTSGRDVSSSCPVTSADTALLVHRQATRPSRRVLIPPPNFGMVEDSLFRSGQPSELNFPFLEKLKLKTIVWLAPEDPGSRFLNFLDDQQITLHHLGVENAVNYDPITEEVVLHALDIIINKDNAPLMVMCNLGRHRTGTVVGIFRKLQRWNLASILEEYRRYAGPKVRVLNEQFIELFDCDLVSIPAPST
ncbi:tyrosine-protein phosphatase required for protection against superoxide stress (By similarity) [Microbotryomycetes sp. JL201]|nr:tyrosine-protein phosphatase required for protection against superoxide stress (By similarity) [Microbotryomycetes sp. JL201]